MTDRGRPNQRERPKGKKSHDPSRYRAIVREGKKGGKQTDISALIREAKKLGDPYYIGLALVSLSSNPGLSLDRATATAEQGIGFASREQRGWRKVELLVEFHKKLSQWREDLQEAGSDDVRNYLIGKVFSQMLRVPPGKVRSEAIQGFAPKSDPLHLEDLMRIALENTGFVLEDSRVVVRSWVRSLTARNADQETLDLEYPDIVGMIKTARDPAVCSRLFGYLHFQLRKEKLIPAAKSSLENALDHSDRISNDAERLESIRYLASIAESRNELEIIKDRLGLFKDPIFVVRGYSTLAGRMDKSGYTKDAGELLQQSLELVRNISDHNDRALIRLNIARGLELCGLKEKARSALEESLVDCVGIRIEERRLKTEAKVISGMRKLGYEENDPLFADFNARREPREVREVSREVPWEASHEDSLDSEKDKEASKERKGALLSAGDVTSNEERKEPETAEDGSKVGEIESDGRDEIGDEDRMEDTHEAGDFQQAVKVGVDGNHVLALYDAYEGGLKPTHIRAIARAAPLCMAFDLDLALVGFPTDDLEGIIKETMRETNVGRGGSLLSTLKTEGRITLIPASSKEPPKNWGNLGVPIATSSHPDPRKRVTFDELADKNGTQKRYCLIMGLGRKGLPPSLLRSVPHHLELTGKNIPLETATVMGIIAERLRSV